MRGVAGEVIPDFPDASTPAVFVYRSRECLKQLMGLDEWGGSRCSVDCIEWVMAHLDIVKTELEDDPRKGAVADWRRPARQAQSDSEQEEGEEEGRDDRCYTSALLGRSLRRLG
mmetsp:Transcript_117487/g.379172  ORF Transcript_117487/g.379172 Transcript_117487/m.379172 type:complete len:114 (+) Transcript_117487:3-344(+)